MSICLVHLPLALLNAAFAGKVGERGKETDGNRDRETTREREGRRETDMVRNSFGFAVLEKPLARPEQIWCSSHRSRKHLQVLCAGHEKI